MTMIAEDFEIMIIIFNKQKNPDYRPIFSFNTTR